MVLQRKQKTSLLELLESHAEGSVPEVAIQTKPPTPFPTHTSEPNPANKKRKWDQKGKDVVEEGKVIPFKEPAKMAKGAQKKSLGNRALLEKGHDPRFWMPIWDLPPFGVGWGSTLPRLFN